jgi:hypothetical protein
MVGGAASGNPKGAAASVAVSGQTVLGAAMAANGVYNLTVIYKNHGNFKGSSKAQHGYEITDTKTGKVVKTGVSGGKKTSDGNGSYRANNQVNRWNREANNSGRYKARIVKEIPAGQGAREKILNWEAKNAAKLRKKGHLNDPTKHSRP